jgi:hypothetical protein
MQNEKSFFFKHSIVPKEKKNVVKYQRGGAKNNFKCSLNTIDFGQKDSHFATQPLPNES